MNARLNGKTYRARLTAPAPERCDWFRPNSGPGPCPFALWPARKQLAEGLRRAWPSGKV